MVSTVESIVDRGVSLRNRLCAICDLMGFFCGFEPPCNKRHSVRLLLQNKKTGLAAARSDVNDWRGGETNHRAADFPAKKKWVRINEHRLQFPVRLAENWKQFRLQIQRILHDVVD